MTVQVSLEEKRGSAWRVIIVNALRDEFGMHLIDADYQADRVVFDLPCSEREARRALELYADPHGLRYFVSEVAHV